MPTQTTPTITLNNGNQIPSLGLGVFRMPPDETEQIVYQGLEAGYRLIDTATFYGNEAEVCAGIAKWLKDNPGHSRKEVFYSTKIWDTDHGYENSKKAIKTRLEIAAPIDYIDMILIHSPQSTVEKRHGTWTALQEAVAGGNVKNIGVSNYGIPHLEELFAYPDFKIAPVVDQVELNPWLMRTQLCQYCQAKGIVMEAFSPLTRGYYLEDPDLVAVAQKHAKTPAQVLINWSLAQGFIPLPKTAKPTRLPSNIDVFDFQLDQKDIGRLSHPDDYKVTIGRWDPSTYPA